MCFTTQKMCIKMQIARKICTELHNIVEASFANVRTIERKHDIHILMEAELEKCIYILCRLFFFAESANWWSRRWKWTSILIRSSIVEKLRGQIMIWSSFTWLWLQWNNDAFDKGKWCLWSPCPEAKFIKYVVCAMLLIRPHNNCLI